jgi:hypothetical protein
MSLTSSAASSNGIEPPKADPGYRSREPPVTKSNSFVRTPETFMKPLPPVAASPSSLPSTPMSQRRRLRINQSPKPPGAEADAPHYRDAPSVPFQPGFYRAPPEDPDRAHVFQLVRRSSSRSRVAAAAIAGGTAAGEGARGTTTSSQGSPAGKLQYKKSRPTVPLIRLYSMRGAGRIISTIPIHCIIFFCSAVYILL